MSRFLYRTLLVLIFAGVAVANATQGNFDPTFGQGGRELVPVSTLGKTDRPVRMALPGQKVLLAGNCAYSSLGGAVANTFCVTQLRSDGSYDGNFGPGGVGYLQFNRFSNWPVDTTLSDVLVLQDGRIALLGYSPEDNAHILLAILQADGTALDPSVGNGSGYLQFQVAGTVSFGISMVQQPDTKLVVAGAAKGPNGNYDFGAARFLADFSGLDSSFGTGGSQTIAFDVGGPGGDDSDEAKVVRLQTDGKMVLAGIAATFPASQTPELFEIAVTRLNTNGTRDQSFGSNGDGRVHYQLSGMDSSYAFDMQIDQLNRIVIGGAALNSAASAVTIQCVVDRLTPNGGRDMTFNAGSPLAFLSPPGFGDTQGGVSRLALNSSGIFAISSPGRAGGQQSAPSYFGVALLNADGSFDSHFGNNGQLYSSFTATGDISATGIDIAVGNGGLMVFGGQTQSGGNGNPVKFGIGRLQYDTIFSSGFE